MSASTGPVSFSSFGLTPGRLTMISTPPITVGNCISLCSCELVRRHRHVGGAEINGAIVDLVDAGAGPDRLVVQLDAGRAGRSFAPLAVDRRGETWTPRR